jgi:hypothetical protein
MLKTASISCAVIAIAGMAAVSVAQAGYGGGTRVHTSYSYRTVSPVSNVTRYRTVTNTRYVPQTTRIVNVTQIQPIHRVNNVTRYLHHTVVRRSNQYSSVHSVGPTRYATTNSVVRVAGPTAHASSRTVYRVHTVNRVTYSTHTRNVWVNHYQNIINRHVTVTRVRPIVHTNVVTRVVTRTVAVPRTVVTNVSRVLPARTVTTARVVHLDP